MKKYTLFLLTAFVMGLAPDAFALPRLSIVEKRLNLSANAGPSILLGTQLVSNKIQLLKCQYDFSKQGGVVGTISLKGPDGANCALPTKAIVNDVLIDVLTAPTGATATIAVGTGQATNDIKAATAVASFTGLMDGVPVGSAATSIKLTADRTPTMTIATANLTAGKFNVFIEYLLSE
jgi:hypothetical protein